MSPPRHPQLTFGEEEDRGVEHPGEPRPCDRPDHLHYHLSVEVNPPRRRPVVFHNNAGSKGGDAVDAVVLEALEERPDCRQEVLVPPGPVRVVDSRAVDLAVVQDTVSLLQGLELVV